MSQPEITYFYSTHSAYAYLGAAKLSAICARFGCRLIHRPFALSPVVERIGGLPFAKRTQAHVDYFFGREIERWAAFRDVPIINHRPTHHDQPLTLSSGMLIAADKRGLNIDRLSHAILQAHWRDDIDLMDGKALAHAARAIGIDPVPLLDAALSPDIQAIFQANTTQAIARSVFGSPTYFLGDEMFYGQDRLEMLERALSQPFPPPTYRNPSVGN